MKKLASLVLSVFFVSAAAFAQNAPKKTKKGHTNQNKFQTIKG